MTSMKLTTEAYQTLVEAGHVPPRHVHQDGEIIEMSSQGPMLCDITTQIESWLRQFDGIVRVQMLLHFAGADRTPEPDVALVRSARYA